MASPLTHRRDVLRALGLGTAGLPLVGCGASFGLTPRRSPVEIEMSPPPPLTTPPIEPAEVIPIERDGEIERIVTEDPLLPLVLPPRLPAGGTIGLIAPAGVLRSRDQLDDAVQAIEGLGFRTKVGRHVLSRHGFLAGTDTQRARDVMTMVTDTEVDAILAVRGGWGCARILPLLDYDEIAAHPKPIIGYSDTTALLLAVYARTGIVTFHGPVGVSTWQGVTPESFVQTLVEGAPLALGPETRANRDRTEAIRPGVAEGRVIGGNLTVISALAGTGFLPDFQDHVVFFEEVGEDAYRVDRMLVQLELAEGLSESAAVVFGQCSSCGSGGSAWTANEAIRQRLATYPCPSMLGAPIGHVSPVYTMPIGLPARVDAEAGTLEYLGPAVA